MACYAVAMSNERVHEHASSAACTLRVAAPPCVHEAKKGKGLFGCKLKNFNVTTFPTAWPGQDSMPGTGQDKGQDRGAGRIHWQQQQRGAASRNASRACWP